jgi:hypothetical protein
LEHKVALLNRAWDGLFELELPWRSLPPQMPMSNWIETQDIHLSTFKMDSLRCVGFDQSGVLALRQLVKLVRANNRRYMKEVGSSVLTDKLAGELKDRWLDRGRSDRPAIKLFGKKSNRLARFIR